MPTKPKAANRMPVRLDGIAGRRQSFTREEAAALLDMSMSTLDAEIQRGKLKAYKKGRHVRVIGAAIDEYMGFQP